jgi:hypothetical protein
MKTETNNTQTKSMPIGMVNKAAIAKIAKGISPLRASMRPSRSIKLKALKRRGNSINK